MSGGLPSEHAVAEAFWERTYTGSLLYDWDNKCWMEFADRKLWKPVPPGSVLNRIRWLTNEMANGHRGVCKNNFFRGVEAIATTFHGFARSREIWNRDRFLLGTPDGTVDLRTGELRAPDSRDHITKATSVAPTGGRPDLWLRFLEEATGGDPGLIRLIQQIFGYCLSGAVSEHVLVFIVGSGGNGKSVLLNTISKILGDYHRTAMADTFMATRHDKHPTELADLEGARLVTAIETEEGRSWAEARIKSLTGGDPITARRMRQDPYTFQPEAKLVFSGNHTPNLKNVDDAMRRRVIILPFTRRPKKVDKGLENKLVQEHSQILQWCIDGFLDYQTNGLVQPGIVLEETEDYFEEQDVRGRWLAECCETDPSYFESIKKLFANWDKYAHAAGEFPGRETGLAQWLKRQGFRGDRQRIQGEQSRVYVGLRLTPAPTPEHSDPAPDASIGPQDDLEW